MLREGDKAPSFALEGDRGSRKLADLKGKRFVLYFYPRDNTPGCTVEAIEFTAAKAKFDALGVPVLGVSRDSVKSHAGFREKHKLGIELLADPDLSVHKAFGVWGEKTMYGKKVEGVIRSTFVVDAAGKLAKVFPNVKVKGHVDAVLAALGGEGAAPTKTKDPAKKPAAAKKAASKPAAKKPAAKKPAAKKK